MSRTVPFIVMVRRKAVGQRPPDGLDPAFELEDQQHGGDGPRKTGPGDQIVDAGGLEAERI